MKNYLKYTLAISLLGLAVASGASAFWGGGGLRGGNLDPTQFAQKLEQKAQLLGIPVAQMTQYWAEGKTIKEIADVIGLSQEELQEKMKANHTAMIQERMQALVDGGVITQEQADQKMQFMQDKMANKGFGRGGMGAHKGDCLNK